MDSLVRGTSADGAIRVLAAITTDTVNRARSIHHSYPVATAAMGRLLTGAAIMGAAGLKNESDSITVQIKGDGPLGALVAVADSKARVKSYVENPFADLPLNAKGKLDVGGAVGKGFLNVVRDLGMKEPYIGQVPLVSGEIAEDLTYYYSKSEQIPTCMALGVLVDTDNSVLAAGGFMIQMLPGSTDEMAERLEKIVNALPPVTAMVNEGISAEELFFRVSEGFDMLMDNNALEPKYECDCSKERMERALISIGKKELRDIIDEQGEAELTCHFCDNKYTFSRSELEELLKNAK